MVSSKGNRSTKDYSHLLFYLRWKCTSTSLGFVSGQRNNGGGGLLWTRQSIQPVLHHWLGFSGGVFLSIWCILWQIWTAGGKNSCKVCVPVFDLAVNITFSLLETHCYRFITCRFCLWILYCLFVIISSVNNISLFHIYCSIFSLLGMLSWGFANKGMLNKWGPNFTPNDNKHNNCR